MPSEVVSFSAVSEKLSPTIGVTHVHVAVRGYRTLNVVWPAALVPVFRIPTLSCRPSTDGACASGISILSCESGSQVRAGGEFEVRALPQLLARTRRLVRGMYSATSETTSAPQATMTPHLARESPVAVEQFRQWTGIGVRSGTTGARSHVPRMALGEGVRCALVRESQRIRTVRERLGRWVFVSLSCLSALGGVATALGGQPDRAAGTRRRRNTISPCSG